MSDLAERGDQLFQQPEFIEETSKRQISRRIKRSGGTRRRTSWNLG
jgi:hypothetical protein